MVALTTNGRAARGQALRHDGEMSASAGPALRVDTDPEEVGLDAERLERLERHFTRYLGDGRLPGWLIAVVRRGRLAYLQTAGRRDLEAVAACADRLDAHVDLRGRDTDPSRRRRPDAAR